MRVTGVDGCRGGWLAATVDDGDGNGDRVSWCWGREIAAIIAAPADAVAIDIPIGLPDGGVRACDVQARRRLGRRSASVFAAPVRPVLGCATYAEARAVLTRRGGPSMSAQAFGIVAAVRQVDAAVSPRDEARVVEAHPELAFATMLGAALPPKKTPQGWRARLEAVGGWLADVDAVVAAAPRPARPDDVLDALACAWVARRWASGTAAVLGDGSRDERGLAMRIVT